MEHRRVQSVRTPVKHVSITGFHVRNFAGCNVAIVGAIDAQVTKNKLSDGLVYGFLTVGSINTHFSGNVVVWTATNQLGFIGACMDNFHDVRISNNHVSGYLIAFCVQTSGADVRDNDASGNCIGVYVDPAVRGAMIHGNHIGPSPAYPKCAGPGSLGVYGIILTSTIESKVKRNVVKGQRNAGEAAGIAIIDEKCIEPSLACLILGNHAPPASGNVVVYNILRNNDVDLLLDTTGTNIVRDNKYSTSKPAKLP
jgi:hypothetical protein